MNWVITFKISCHARASREMSGQQRARGRGDKSAHRRLEGDTPERISEVIVRNISNSILFLIGHSQVTLYPEDWYM